MADSETSNSAPAIGLGLAIAPVLLAAVNLYLGRSEFGGYDLSVLIDSGWRLMNGQIPTADFISTLPPSFYLLAAAAFRIFGVNWSSLLYAESLLYLLLCFLGLRLCRLLRSAPEGNRDRCFRPIYIASVYIAAQSLSLLAVNHLWHSATASAVAAYAILATYTRIRLASAKGAGESTVHLAFAFAFLLLSKPNTAWAAVVLCLLCLASDRRLWRPALLAIAAAVAADLLLLAALRISPYNAFHGYLGLGNRAVPRMFLSDMAPQLSLSGLLSNPPVYLFLLWPAWAMVKIAWKERSRLMASPASRLAISAVAVSLIGFGTNWEMKIVDVAPFLIGAAILAVTSEDRCQSLMRPALWSAVLLLLLAAFFGIQRTRMIGVGNWAGPNWGSVTRIHDSFFGDFTTRRYFAELLPEVDFVTAHTRGRRTFFGPRLEFLYARNGLPSPVHLPVWWHPGTSYPVAMEPWAVQAWKDDRFDVLIFQRNDRTRFPPELLWYIEDHYTRSPDFPVLDVYYRE